MRDGFTCYLAQVLRYGSLLLIVSLCSAEMPAIAQRFESASPGRYTVALRDVPLDAALQRFIQRTSTDIAYSNDLVAGRSVYCRTRNATTDELLACLLAGTGIDYVQTSTGTYLLVDAFRAPDARGQITGTVVDAATGEPLPRANILLADAGTGAATSSSGRFSIADVIAGAHQLVVTHVGYAAHTDSVWIPAAGRHAVRVALDPQPLIAEPLIVDGLQQRLPSAELGRAAVDLARRKTMLDVGTPDFLRSIGGQVGVTQNRPRAALHVQGGGAGEHMTLLDGVPIRQPVSVGGLLSAFSPKALGRITVHKAGFEAERGSYTSGVIAAEHDLARSGARYAAVSADPVSVDGRAEMAWARGEARTGRAMLAARQSVWDAYQSPALYHMLSTWAHPDPTLAKGWLANADTPGTLRSQHPASHVRFTDVHAALDYELSPFHRLHASAYHGTSALGTDAATVLTGADASRADASRLLATTGRTGWDNTMMQARYDGLLSARATGRLQVYRSRHDSHSFFGLRDSLLSAARPAEASDLPEPSDLGRMDHTDEGNALGEWGARAAVDLSLSSPIRLRAAVEPAWMWGRIHMQNRFLGRLRHDVRTWQVGSSLQGEASLGPATTITAGTRLTYRAARQTVYAEPRLSLRHDRTVGTLGDVALRLAGGVYRQYVLQSEISNDGPLAVVPSMQFWLPLDASLSPPRAYHAAVDLLVRPTDAWQVRLETFYKHQPRTLQIDYAGLVRSEPLLDARTAPMVTHDDQAAFMAAGEGRAYGAALRLQRSGPRVTGDLTAEVERTWRRYPGRFGGRFVPAPWEQPVRLTANLDIELADGLHALGSWQGTWGRPWALRRAYYDYTAQTANRQFLEGPDLNRPGDQVLAPFSRFDLGLKVERRLRGVALQTQLSVVNVLDRPNPFDRSLGTPGAPPGGTTRTLPGRRFFMLLGVRY